MSSHMPYSRTPSSAEIAEGIRIAMQRRDRRDRFTPPKALRPSLQYLDRIARVTMDLAKPSARLIALGRYSYVKPEITQYFGFGAGDGIRTTDIFLLHYKRKTTSDLVIADMDRQGLRPANYQELLWVGVQHPLLQLEFPVIALGTVVQVGRGRGVADLGQYERERGVWMDQYAEVWHVRCRFAAVRM